MNKYSVKGYCPDLILSDYDLPLYNGAIALIEAGRHCPDTPFILVTGACDLHVFAGITNRGVMQSGLN